MTKSNEKKLTWEDFETYLPDYQFDEKKYPELKIWYEQTIKFCEDNGYSFISYDDAIKELEENENN